MKKPGQQMVKGKPRSSIDLKFKMPICLISTLPPIPRIVCGAGKFVKVPGSKSFREGEVQQDAPVSINIGNDDTKGKFKGWRC